MEHHRQGDHIGVYRTVVVLQAAIILPSIGSDRANDGQRRLRLPIQLCPIRIQRSLAVPLIGDILARGSHGEYSLGPVLRSNTLRLGLDDGRMERHRQGGCGGVLLPVDVRQMAIILPAIGSDRADDGQRRLRLSIQLCPIRIQRSFAVPLIGDILARGFHGEDGLFPVVHRDAPGLSRDHRRIEPHRQSDLLRFYPAIIILYQTIVPPSVAVNGPQNGHGRLCLIVQHSPFLIGRRPAVPHIGEVLANGSHGEDGLFSAIHRDAPGLGLDDRRMEHHRQGDHIGVDGAVSIAELAIILPAVVGPRSGKGQGGRGLAVQQCPVRILRSLPIPLIGDGIARGFHREGCFGPAVHRDVLGLRDDDRPGGHVIMVTDGQLLLAIESYSMLIEGTPGPVEFISRADTIVVSLEKIHLPPAAVAPGHVHQIGVSVIHTDQVPHMGSARVTGDDEAVDPVALEFREVAQVLESLGIALADDVGAGVPVESPDELPGIAEGIAGFQSVVIILHQVADLLVIAAQLLVIRNVFVSIDDGSGVVTGRDHRLADGRVHREIIPVLIVGADGQCKI